MRVPRTKPRPPSPSRLQKARSIAGLDLEAAAMVVYHRSADWASWERGDSKMDPRTWELWTLKVSRWCPGVSNLLTA